MKHATTLVCIILMLLFLNPGTDRLEIWPEAGQDSLQTENNAKNKAIRGKDEKTKGYNDIPPEQQEEDNPVSSTSLPLSGKIICIDPGHQPKMVWEKVPIAPGESFLMPDYSIGTRGVKSETYEYSISFQVAQKLERLLRSLGGDVVLTRELNEQAVSNIRRAEIANEAIADVAVRLHCDGIEDPTIHGLSVLYPGDKYLKDSEILNNSLMLSESVLKSTVSSTNAKNRGLSKRNDLIVFNYSKVPTTLIEMGFLTNPNEDMLLNSEEYQNQLANGIAQGIVDYFKGHEAAAK